VCRSNDYYMETTASPDLMALLFKINKIIAIVNFVIFVIFVIFV